MTAVTWALLMCWLELLGIIILSNFQRVALKLWRQKDKRCSQTPRRNEKKNSCRNKHGTHALQISCRDVHMLQHPPWVKARSASCRRPSRWSKHTAALIQSRQLHAVLAGHQAPSCEREHVNPGSRRVKWQSRGTRAFSWSHEGNPLTRGLPSPPPDPTHQDAIGPEPARANVAAAVVLQWCKTSRRRTRGCVLPGDAVLPLQLRHLAPALNPACSSLRVEPLACPPCRNPCSQGLRGPAPPPLLASSPPATAQTPERYHHASGMFNFNLTQNQKDFSRIQKPHVGPKLPAGTALPYKARTREVSTQGQDCHPSTLGTRLPVVNGNA